MTSFFWHDYETWGAAPAFDKPVQFAGVRTDLDFNIIDDPVNILCKPPRDYLPNPEACLVTGLSPLHALEHGMIEPEFIARVHRELSSPGTCGVGYNSIRFDDEVTRYALWRNFYDPYEREYLNGNSRWDIIDMVRMTYALRPEAIEWPMIDGVASFKLENLSAANNLAHENAHDALSDVYATIGMAKLIKQQQPKLFDYLFELRDKRKAAALIDIANHKPLLHVSSRFPASNGCAALVLPLAAHPVNKNSFICFDLSQNPDDLLSLPAESIIERLYTKTEDLPDGVSRIALKEVHINKSPALATAKLLDETSAQRLGIDLDTCRKHWQQLKNHTLANKLAEVYRHNPFNDKRDPESALYQGFLSNLDKKRVLDVRHSAPDELAKQSFPFDDSRLPELLFRFRARNYPETLNATEQAQWQEHCQQQLVEPGYGYLGYEALQERIFELQEQGELTDAQIQLLDELSHYADGLVS